MEFLFGALQAMAIVALSVACAVPMGGYLASAFSGKPTCLDRALDPVERAISWALGGIDGYDMDWKEYAISMILTNAILWAFSFAVLCALGMTPDLAFHTASSFTTNTDQQHYAGDTFSPLGQALVITALMFFSAATGLASAFAVIRGLKAADGKVGNFFKDAERGLVRVLLPLSVIFALILAACGVPQSFGGTLEVKAVTGAVQSIPLGPVASLEAIKMIGTNGGGYYGANSAHPYENPSPLTNVLELFFTLLIPLALPYTFGIMIGNRRQGLLLMAVMLAIFVPMSLIMMYGESSNPYLPAAVQQASGYLEGKEARFSAYESAFYLATCTYVQCGAASCSITSMMPWAVVGAMFGMMAQCVPGGIGAGLDIMLIYVLLSVFIAGLMVGRTPEFLGKKVEPAEMKLIALIIIVHPILVLTPTALTALISTAHNITLNPGARGFAEIMYEFLSASANNGSGMAGLKNTTLYFNVLSGLVMLLGRYVPLVAALAVAGSLSGKRPIEATPGTLPTDNLTFAAFLLGIIIIVGAITFLPALSLGPLAEIFALR
ncbi:K+-transporting ATPase, KdpA [Methanocella conradii HZ254]|uniref:Potassium-transporting ATPase potassium-binding subunit n=1 Tax=Methanocella conradii (strain DSM 24694 / JCM 17849 / CGMCC 1.5162 / HZ254) TaxID=1041930 RepID=H8I6H3_METCZ|nr:potassium-transporting ATPase subunit KdpA [Methanocella conradii]AFD01171.1 K+-transporting ATPase, KdpA [Methanocella conradii HZ254]